MSTLPVNAPGAIHKQPPTRERETPAIETHVLSGPEMASGGMTQDVLNARSAYRDLCETELSIPLFSRAWWLDAVAGESAWNVAVVRKGKELIASMPYCSMRKLGFSLIVHPPLTQTLGPWLRQQADSPMKALSDQKKLMRELIAQLPPYDYFEQRWHYSLTNWLPFYWEGFQQTTRYTYVLDDISDPEKVFARFSHGKKQDLKKSANTLEVRFHIPAQEFYEHHVMSLAQRKSKILYSSDLFHRIYTEGYRRNAACTVAAYDASGRMHAGIFIVWDENSAYGLINSIDQETKSSGAGTLLTREVIRYLSTRTRKFDFEGSMMQNVEASLRQYNTQQTPYFCITRTPSTMYPLLKALKSISR